MVEIFTILLEKNALITVAAFLIIFVLIIAFIGIILTKFFKKSGIIRFNYKDGLEISTSTSSPDKKPKENGKLISDFLFIIEDTVPTVLGRMVRTIVEKESERFNMDSMKNEKIERICKAAIYDLKRAMISHMIDVIKERTNERSVNKILQSPDYIAVEEICESSCNTLKNFTKVIVERNHLDEIIKDDSKIGSLLNEMRTYIYTEIGSYNFGHNLNVNKIDMENMLISLSDTNKDILKKSIKEVSDTNKEFRQRDFSIDEEIQSILEEITAEIMNHVTIKLQIMENEEKDKIVKEIKSE